jgi:flavin reductase (DIM6/NTAB) family NADH-FMN oxidoreductase RutF
VDVDAFDEVMAALDPAVAVLTVAVDGERSGCLVGFHSQSSIEPRCHSVWISKANHTYDLALVADFVAVHALTRADHDLAELFGSLTGDEVDKFSRCEWAASAYGPPLLARCPNRLLLRRRAVLDYGGDHVGFVTDLVDAESGGPFEPLRLSHVGDLEPGHHAGG